MRKATPDAPDNKDVIAGCWPGHHPSTRSRLQEILSRAAYSDAPISLRDRVLVNVCEFRAKLANGDLLAYLETDTQAKLGAARFTLNEIGAMSLAARISDALAEARRSHGKARTWQAFVKLEADLAAAGRALDEAIAAYSITAGSTRDAGAVRYG